MNLLARTSARLGEFAAAAEEAKTQEALWRLTRDAGADLGFDYFSFVHHVATGKVPPDAVGMVHFPASLDEQVEDRIIVPYDPVHVACQRTTVGFRWSQIENLIPLSEPQRQMLTESVKRGLGEGFTVPVHLPGEYSGSATFVTRPGMILQDDFVPLAQWLGVYVFELIRKLTRDRMGTSDILLSPRQADCVYWICRGKSERDTAQILGLSPETVHSYMKTIRSKWGVSSQRQVIAHALFRGIVSYADVF